MDRCMHIYSGVLGSKPADRHTLLPNAPRSTAINRLIDILILRPTDAPSEALMLEVGWHRSAQLGGDGWWCAVVFSAGTRGAPDLHAILLQSKLDYIWTCSYGAVFICCHSGRRRSPVRRWKCTLLYICGDAFATAAWC